MLSKSWRNRKKTYDFVVVGSGYGGSITAARIATANLEPAPSVCMLERGREWPVGKFPDTFGKVVSEFRDKGNPLGLYEILRYPDLSVLKGCGLGGTSLINANVAAIPDPEVFEEPEWPRWLTLKTLEPYMQRAKRALGAQPDPRAWSFKKVEAMDRRAQQMGKRAQLMDLTINHAPWHFNRHGVFQRPCLGCGDCTTGCNHHSKNTLYMNYLPMARNAGADIFTKARVKWIEKRPEGGWRVHGRRYEGGILDSRFRIEAAHVILAAGSVHSTEILLRSQMRGLSLSSALGTGFSCNGDFFGLSYNGDFKAQSIGFGNHPDSPVAQTPPGPGIVSGIHYNSNLPLKQRMHIEDYSIASAYVQAAKKAFAALKGEDSDIGDKAEEKRRIKRDLNFLKSHQPDGALNHTMVYMVMSFDDSRGKMILKKPNGKVEIVWDEAGRQPVYTRLNEELRRHARAQGGSYISNPLWDLFEMRRLMTAHPLGGCPLGEDSDQGAVDEFGRVFSAAGQVHEGLFVADGAIIPSSIGINPLVTISALAERIAERKIRALQGDPYPARQPMVSVPALPQVQDGDEADLERVFMRRPGMGAEVLPGSGGRQFDDAEQVFRNGLLWRGFFPRDHLLNDFSAPIFKGFQKEFHKDGDQLAGVTSDLADGLKVRHQIEEIKVEKRSRELEPGRYLLLRYLDDPWKGLYEILKAVEDDMVVGRAYAGRFPKGTRLYTFAMSRRYGFDQMTPEDHRILFEAGPAPSADELEGTWRMDLISPANRAAGLAYLKFDLDSEGRPSCSCRLAGLLEGLLIPESFRAHFQCSDCSSIQDEIRTLDGDRMLGKYVADLDGEQAEMLSALGLLHPEQGRLGYRYFLVRVKEKEYPAHTVLSPHLSAQLPDGLGLALEEEMVGWFLPGLAPAPMSEVGSRPDGAVDCRLRVRLAIRDLNEFIDGPAHEARLAGSLSIAEFEGEGNFELKADKHRSSFQYQQLDRSSNEAHIRYRLQGAPTPQRQLVVQGFKSLRKDENGGVGGWREMVQDYTTFYGSMEEAFPETKTVGTIFLKSKTAQDMAVLGNLKQVFNSWRVTGTDNRLLQLQAKMRFLAFAGRYLRIECDPTAVF